MARNPQTYSESWHRVADQRISVRPDVVVRRQFFHGEKWFVLQDPFNNQFFRIRPAANEFISRLSGKKTVQEVWLDVLNEFPDDAPGQQEVIQLLAQLYHANLLYYQFPADSVQLFDRYEKRRRKELKSKLLSIMFARFPLLDPDAFLVSTLPFLRLIFSPIGIVIWCAVVAVAVKLGVDNSALLLDQSQAVLAPGNLILLYGSLVALKVIHEFGHAYACRHYGGEVHVMGVMLLVFTPIPYVDASSSWAFRSRWQRLLVAAAGMVVELFVAAIAMIVWARTGPGTIHSLAYNIIFIASVSTILFNINPLLRFDGYYMLCDLLDLPNLHQQGKKMLVYIVERFGFGCENTHSPAGGRGEAAQLFVFAILAGIYRIVISVGIVLFVADNFLLAGIVMALVCVLSWMVTPVVRLFKYLGSSPKLVRHRGRAIAVTVGVLGGVFVLLYVLPMPCAFRAPGVLQATDYTQVVTASPGYLGSVSQPSGSIVKEGEILLKLNSRELELQQGMLRAQYQRALAMRRQAIHQESVNLPVLDRQISELNKQKERLKEQRAALAVRAPFRGNWSAPEAEQYLGTFLPRGTVLGEITNDTFRFVAVVSQEEAGRLFGDNMLGSEIRLTGQGGRPLQVRAHHFVAAGQRLLPSAAIGWGAGGEVAIDAADASGRRAAESFYTVIAEVKADDSVAFVHGLTGTIRFELADEPLLRQWMRTIHQTLQQRYGI